MLSTLPRRTREHYVTGLYQAISFVTDNPILNSELLFTYIYTAFLPDLLPVLEREREYTQNQLYLQSKDHQHTVTNQPRVNTPRYTSISLAITIRHATYYRQNTIHEELIPIVTFRNIT